MYARTPQEDECLPYSSYFLSAVKLLLKKQGDLEFAQLLTCAHRTSGKEIVAFTRVKDRGMFPVLGLVVAARDLLPFIYHVSHRSRGGSLARRSARSKFWEEGCSRLRNFGTPSDSRRWAASEVDRTYASIKFDILYYNNNNISQECDGLDRWYSKLACVCTYCDQTLNLPTYNSILAQGGLGQLSGSELGLKPRKPLVRETTVSAGVCTKIEDDAFLLEAFGGSLPVPRPGPKAETRDVPSLYSKAELEARDVPSFNTIPRSRYKTTR